MNLLSRPGVAVILLIGCIAPISRAQSISTQAEMHARVQALYNFSPSKVSAQERTSKSAEMDTFWNEVKSHKETELPLLRKELQDPANPSFFFADGSGLLISLSDSPEDRKLVVVCLARVNFVDFQSRQYLYEVHHLATQGVDVTPAALHILDDPKFEAYLPEHAYRMDQSSCLLESLLPLPESVWLPPAIKRIKTEHEETALRSLLLLLYYAQADEADEYLRLFAADANEPKVARDFTVKLLKHERDLGIGKQPSHEAELKAREARRKRMFGLSDEAMDDLEELTGKIAKARTVSPANR